MSDDAADGTVLQQGLSVAAGVPGTLAVGAELGAYRVTGLAGHGGMGTVYRAWDVVLERPVALKVLKWGLAEPFRLQLRREARLAAALDHPNVVPIYAWGEDGATVFIVMRYVEGTDLRRLVDVQGPLAPARALRLLRQAASALDAAHAPEKGLLHRDVKPQNLLLGDPGTPAEQVYLADFGLASSRLLAEGGLTYEPGSGTAAYMAPEQVMGEELDPRADIYAFAAVAMFLLTGDPPFTGATPAEIAVAHIRREPPSACERRPELPAGVDAVLAAGLAKDRGARPASGREFVERLEAALHGEGAPEPVIARLPVQLTSFVGRTAEVSRVRSLLIEARLITITGPGGVGKSRLAQAAVDGWAGVSAPVLVELGAIAEGSSVAGAVAAALRVKVNPGESAEDAVISMLASARRLVLLDNCEHLVDALVPYLTRVLAACPGVSVLATSRVPLGLGGETVIATRPLPVPRGGLEAADLAENASVALFVTRAAAAGATLDLAGAEGAAVAAICRRLDGIPLAIELAARRTRAMPPSEIAVRLDDALAFLTGGARGVPDRQRTLAATMRWTYDLLQEQEQAAFRALAVFAGGFDLAALEAVWPPCGAVQIYDVPDVLTALVDWSLVARDPDLPGRYRMLETARGFALHLVEQDSAEYVCAREAHLRWCVSVVRDACLAGPTEQAGHVAAIERNLENIRAALRFAESTDAPQGALLGLASWFGRFSHRRATSLEAARWLAQGLERGGENDDLLRGMAWGSLLAAQFGDRPRTEALATAALAACADEGSGPVAPVCRLALGLVSAESGDVAVATEHWEAGLAAARTAEPSLEARFLNNLAALAFDMGNPARAIELNREAIVLAQQRGERDTEAHCNINLGVVAMASEQIEAAAQYFDRAITLGGQGGNLRAIASARHYRSLPAMDCGDLDGAADLLMEALRVFRRVGQRPALVEVVDTFAELASLQGRPDEAARLFGVVDATRAATGLCALSDLKQRHDAVVARCEAALGSEAYAAAHAQGSADNLDDLVTVLLAQSPP